MVDDIRFRGINPRSIVDPLGETPVSPSQEARGGPTFDEILAARLPAGTVKVSAHAKASLEAANIELSPMDLDRIGRGVDRLAEAGGQQGLLIDEKAAFKVDVATRHVTAVTAATDVRDTVFTQVDCVLHLD